MVVSFFIQSVSADPIHIASLYYWEPFGFVTEAVNEHVEKTATKEKENVNLILARVQSEFLFQKQVNDFSEDKKELQYEAGIFRLSKQTMLQYDCNVLWQSCYGCAFVMLLSANENVSLAEYILSLMVQYAANIYNMMEENHDQLLAYPDKMSAVLHVFLPAGQLIFMNHRLVKQLEKDLDKILSENK